MPGPRIRRVDCREHGPQQETFVCRHIVQGLKEGVAYGFCSGSDPDNPRPDAWCQSCDERLQQSGGEWNNQSEAQAGVTLLCGACYDRARAMNLAASG